jgi:hypothetical protein
MKGHANVVNKPTLAVVVCDGDQIAATIPLDGIVTVAEDQRYGNRLVQVMWEGKSVMMFRQDLCHRGDFVISVKV